MDSLAWNRIRYNFYAPFYNVIEPLFARSRKKSILQLGLQAGDRVLLIGSGTGLDLEFLPDGVQVCAVDISPNMVARTERKARNLNLDCRAQVMDAAELEYESNSFDAVILHLVLAVVPDPESCAAEIARVLKPEGRAAILDKFLPDQEEASWLRSGFNLFANFWFSDINRKLGPILQAGGLEVVHSEPDLFGGAFQRVLIRPQASPGEGG